jgi:DNA polymerase III sliding clamp (beta) subunit (PCNA family)
MLKELKFVQGAIAKKTLVPAMTHFSIDGGRVRSYNGTLALCSPIPFGVDCKPKAVPLVKAIAQCKEQILLSITPSGKLSIKSGPFKALIECIDEETPHVEPEGQSFQFNSETLLPALKTLSKFIGDDASRPWTNGVLLKGHSAFATNNVILVEHWLDDPFPYVVNIPEVAVDEMLRIGEHPVSAQIGPTSITFHYGENKWLRTQLLETSWPDLNELLDQESHPVEVNPAVFTALEAVRPFTDKMGRVIFENGSVRTHEEEAEGASYEIPDFPYSCKFRIEMLDLLKDYITRIDLTTYPKPCPFFGPKLRGVIVGLR